MIPGFLPGDPMLHRGHEAIHLAMMELGGVEKREFVSLDTMYRLERAESNIHRARLFLTILMAHEDTENPKDKR